MSFIRLSLLPRLAIVALSCFFNKILVGVHERGRRRRLHADPFRILEIITKHQHIN